MADPLTEKIIGAAIEVHRHLGPGLLEAICEEALCVEFSLRGITFERQKELGSVDILPQPDERASELEESQVSSVQFVKPGEYPAKVLDLVDEALHQMPLPV